MVASAIISNTWLTSLHRADTFDEIIFAENKPHIMKYKNYNNYKLYTFLNI